MENGLFHWYTETVQIDKLCHFLDSDIGHACNPQNFGSRFYGLKTTRDLVEQEKNS